MFSAGESEAGLRDDESDDDDEEDMTDEEPDIEALEAAEAEEKAKAEAEMAARLRKKEPPAENQPRKKQDDGEYRSLFTISDDDKGKITNESRYAKSSGPFSQAWSVIYLSPLC